MTTGQLGGHIRKHWETFQAKLLAGTYVPSPVKRVEIPKPNGGTRRLGIPTVVDRWIQQMLLQALQPIFDPAFSEHSHGFRPGRSTHDAVRARQSLDPMRFARSAVGAGPACWTWTSPNSSTPSITTS